MINKGLSRLGTFFLYLVSLLPFWVLYILSDFIFLLIYYVIGYRRKVVQENLLNSFPEKTEEERRAIEKKYFKYLADLTVETVKMITVSKKEIYKRVTSPNRELLQKYFEQGRSVMMALGHYGNWEMADLRMSLEIDKPLLVVYKPLTNDTFDQFFIKIRSRFGCHPGSHEKHNAHHGKTQGRNNCERLCCRPNAGEARGYLFYHFFKSTNRLFFRG